MNEKLRFSLPAFLLLLLLTAAIPIGFVIQNYCHDASKEIERALSKRQINQKSSIIIKDKNNRVIEQSPYHHPVELKRVPQLIIDAFTSAEDRHFFHHRGIDIFAIARAYISNIRSGRIVQGASTITQQVTRMLFLHNQQTYQRKIREIIFSLALELKLEKRRILELYLNRVYLGRGSYGIAAAAKVYFGKNIEDLSLGEASLLAGLPKAPSYLAPHKHYERAKARQKYVLGQMLRNNKINFAQYKKWVQKGVKILKNPKNYQKEFAYFTREAKKELNRKIGINEKAEGLYQLTVTLDSRLDQALSKIIKHADAKGKASTPQGQEAEVEVAYVTLDIKTGSVLALRGGHNFRETEFNRAIKTRRALNVLFTPIMIGIILNQGYSLFDQPGRIPGRHRDRGGLSSQNLYDDYMSFEPYNLLDVFLAIGKRDLLKKTRDLGLKFKLNNISLVLGHGRATPLEVATAYATLLNGGKRVEKKYLSAIKTQDGKVLRFESSKNNAKVISSESSFILNDLLRRSLKKQLNISVLNASVQRKKDHREGGILALTPDLHNGWIVIKRSSTLTVVWVGSEKGASTIAHSKDGAMEYLRNLSLRTLITLRKHIYPSQPDKPPTSISYRRVKNKGTGSELLPFVPRRNL